MLPAFNEPLANLILHGLLDVRSLCLADLVFDVDQSLLILLLMHLLCHTACTLNLEHTLAV